MGIPLTLTPPQILPMGHVPEGYHLHISLPVAYGITETQVCIAFMSSYSFCVPLSLDLSQYIGAILWVSHKRKRLENEDFDVLEFIHAQAMHIIMIL